MFTKKNKSQTTKETPTNSTAKSWIEGKIGSALIGSAIGLSLYYTGIITKIYNYLSNLTKPTPPTTPDTQTRGQE